MKKQRKPVMNPEEFCPIRQTIKILGKKWTILIIKDIYYSSRKKLSFMELRRRLENASAKVLSERLKEMMKNKLVKRKVQANTTPPRVYYSLTEKGTDACHIVDDMKKYGLKWGGEDTRDCEKIDCELCAKTRDN